MRDHFTVLYAAVAPLSAQIAVGHPSRRRRKLDSFIAPSESSASSDDLETRPATTELRSDDAPSGGSEDVVDLNADTNTTALGDVPASSVFGGAEADVVESLTPEPPTATTPSVDDVTETAQSSRRRPTRPAPNRARRPLQPRS